MPSSLQPLVAFRGVSKSYDGTSLAVRHLDLDIAPGSFFTMLGPSGSGKTTSLMMLAGFEQPSGGRIEIAGRDVDRLPPHDRGIGMVFQNYALFPHMTVAQNLAFPLVVRKLSRSETDTRLQRILDIMQLDGLRDRRPAQLSGGQQQRVALGRALVFEPQLVLMDEPLGALDKQLRDAMQREITELAHTLGITVLYVTHDQSEALAMSDTIAVFNNGRVEQVAAPRALYEHPANSFVANFIGENNSLTGTVVDVAGDMAHVRLSDGTRLEARNVEGLEPGDASTIAIRPERVVIGAARTGTAYHTCKAQVLGQQFMGDGIRTRLRIADNDRFFAFRGNGPDWEPVTTGETVDVSWRNQDCHAFSA